MVDFVKLRQRRKEKTMATSAAQTLETPKVLIPAATEVILSPANGGLPAIPEALMNFTGAEGLSTDDLIIPRYKIIQPTSKVGTPGNLICNILGQETPALDIVIVKIDKGRVMWDKDNFEKPICRSHDYMVPDPKIEHPPSPVCAKMMLNKATGKEQAVQMCRWGSWEGSEKPPCGLTYNILALSLEDNMMPFWISLHGASVKPVKQYSSSILLRRKPFWQFQTTLSLVPRTEPHKHYVAKFEMPKAIPDNQISAIMESVQALKDVSIQRTYEFEEIMTAEDEGEASGEDGFEDTPPRGQQTDSDMPDFMKDKK
jgi:hypothetical protein